MNNSIDFRRIYLAIISKFNTKFLIRSFKVKTFAIFIHQTILLSIDYLKFQTFINLKLKPDLLQFTLTS
jgi:hypothetical protein